MNQSRRSILLAAALACVAVMVPSSASAATKVAAFQMYDSPKVKPDKWFFTANSGPYLEKLRWDNWGKDRTKATGVYVQDCASCGDELRRPALLTFWRIRPCPKHDMRAYTRGRLEIINDDGSRKRVGPQNPDYRSFCK